MIDAPQKGREKLKIIRMNRFIALTLTALLFLGLLPPVTRAQTPVKGKNVTIVAVQGSFNRPRELADRFVFRQTKVREWQIVNVRGGAVTSCQETNRDEWSVYLYCMLTPSRTMRGYPNTGYKNSRVVLNLFKKEVTRDYAVMGNVIRSRARPLAAPKVPTKSVAKSSTCKAPLVKGSRGTCLPRVYFHARPGGMSLPEAQGIALKNGWVIANANEITRAWGELRLDKYAFGMLDDGRFAIPLQSNRPNFNRGTNIGVKGGNQGFFYVPKAAVSRKQIGPVVSASTRSAVGLPSTLSPQTQQQLQMEIAHSALTSPMFGRNRFEYLCSSNPGNPMLDADRQLRSEAMHLLLKKEGFPSQRLSIAGINSRLAKLRTDPVRRWQFAPFMLRVMWNALVAPRPTAAQAQFRKKFEKWAACDETKIAKMTLALWNNHIGKSNSPSGSGWFGPARPYRPNTLGVLIDVKTGRGSIEGFLPLGNPWFIGNKGTKAMSQLYDPMLVHSNPKFDDPENFRALDDEMSKIASHIGITVGGAGGIVALAGAPVIAGSVGRGMAQFLSMAESKVANSGGRISIEAAKATLRQQGTTPAKLSAKFLAERLGKAVVKEVGEEAAEEVAKKIAGQAGRMLGSKVIAAAAVIGVIAMMGEVFGTVVSDAVKTNQYNASLNKAANTITDYDVRKFLGRNPNKLEKSIVFTQLVKMTIADPADLGLLTLNRPKPVAKPAKPNNTINPVGRGLVRFQNDWYKDRYVHIQNNQKAEVGRIQPNWYSAIWKLVPVGGGWVRIQSQWYKDRYLFYDAPKNKLEVGPIQPNWHSAQWKLVPAGGGWVRIQSRWYPNRFLYYDAPNNKLKVGPIKPNWASARWKVQ